MVEQAQQPDQPPASTGDLPPMAGSAAGPAFAAPVQPQQPLPPVYMLPGYPPGAVPYPGPHPYPAYPQYAYPPGAYPPLPLPGPSAADKAAQAANQKLLLTGIIAAVLVVHLPWLIYLLAVQGCWGSFIDLCLSPPEAEMDSLTDTPFLFAQVTFFMLRVQSVLAVDWAHFSEVMQISTGLGSFLLTKIVAAKGTVAQGNLRRYALAGTCAVAFVILFWAEIHLTGTSTYPVLGDETVLGYIDLELPADFVSAKAAEASLLQYLQILRLADALIFGAALAMPKAPKGP